MRSNNYDIDLENLTLDEANAILKIINSKYNLIAKVFTKAVIDENIKDVLWIEAHSQYDKKELEEEINLLTKKM